MKDHKAYSKLIAKAWSDPKFKERLFKDPEHVLHELGIDVPKGKKIQFHENNDKVIHFVLPEKPHGELSERELESRAAGATAPDCTPTPHQPFSN